MWDYFKANKTDFVQILFLIKGLTSPIATQLCDYRFIWSLSFKSGLSIQQLTDKLFMKPVAGSKNPHIST